MHTSRHPFNCLFEIWIEISYKLLAGSSHFCFMVCLFILYMFFALMCLLVYIFDKKGDGWEALTQTHNNRWLLLAPTTRLPYIFLSFFPMDCWFVALVWFVCLFYLYIWQEGRWMGGSQLAGLSSHTLAPTSSHTLAPIILQRSQPIKVQLYL